MIASKVLFGVRIVKAKVSSFGKLNDDLEQFDPANELLVSKEERLVNLLVFL